MTEKRFILKEDCDWWGIKDNQLPKTKFGFREDLPEPYLECDYEYNDLTHQEVVDLLNKYDKEYNLCHNDVLRLEKENEQLKEEVELLRFGLKEYESILPRYLDCAEISSFRADLFEFEIKQLKFYKKNQNLCKIVVDGVEYE